MKERKSASGVQLEFLINMNGGAHFLGGPRIFIRNYIERNVARGERMNKSYILYNFKV